ncbi:DMT family transporter [Patescibacteria group bacterium]|nr:DMT family transporter [Patescibacteria group bacterium]
MNKNKFLGLVGVLGAAFLGGAILPSLIRTGTAYLHPFIFNWLRVTTSTIILLILFGKKFHYTALLNQENLPLLIITGIGFGLNLTLFSVAINHTTLIASQLIFVMVPVATGFLAHLFVNEKITKQKIFGLLISLVGVLILVVASKSPQERSSLGSFYGNSLIFIGMLGYSAYLTFSKKYNINKSVVEMLILTNLALTIFCSPLALYALFFTSIHPYFSWPIFISVTGIIITSMAFIGLSQLAIKKLPVSTAAFSSLLSPEFAAFAGIIFYHEKLSPILILSLVLAIYGVIISTNMKRKNTIDWLKILLQIKN